MNTVYLLLGSNLGNSAKQLETAISAIGTTTGKIKKSSSLYQTAPWGNTEQPIFLNQVVLIETLLSAGDVLKSILKIENNMGRTREFKNEPRKIDIDILFYNAEIIKKDNLIIPHPLLQNRRFVLVPLNEIAGEYIHPVFNKTVNQLLESCTDMLEVKRIYST